MYADNIQIHFLYDVKCFLDLKTSYNGKFVNIGPVVGKDDKIWTIVFNENLTESTPLLIIHGLGAGSAYWVGNLDEITAGRTVYVIDFLGLCNIKSAIYVSASSSHNNIGMTIF